jgi:hypothetical protein
MAFSLADEFLDACVHNKLQIVKNLFHRLDVPTIEVIFIFLNYFIKFFYDIIFS